MAIGRAGAGRHGGITSAKASSSGRLIRQWYGAASSAGGDRVGVPCAACAYIGRVPGTPNGMHHRMGAFASCHNHLPAQSRKTAGANAGKVAP